MQFNIGATVRVTGPSAYAGDVGEVIGFAEGEWYPYSLAFRGADNGQDDYCSFMASELEPA